LSPEDGLNFILSHFEEPLWPRTVSTRETHNSQILVASKDEAQDIFIKSKFKDCRISAFGQHEQVKVIPNLIFVDLDNRDALDETLILFHKTIKARPTVIDTGNGYGIIQPIKMSPWNDKKIVSYKRKQPDELAKMFLQWVERYLTNYKCDTGNHPSLNNTMIRIPGTYNTKLLERNKSKNISQVKIVYGWDRIRVPTESIRQAFISHVDKIILSEQKRNKFLGKSVPHAKNFKWIKKMLDCKISDGRERLLFDVTRYLLNICGDSVENSTSKIHSWLDSRHYEESRIKSHCFRALKDKKYPRRLKTIRNSDSDLYNIIMGTIKN